MKQLPVIGILLLPLPPPNIGQSHGNEIQTSVSLGCMEIITYTASSYEYCMGYPK